MTAVDELLAFLRATWDARCAQLDEDEQVARECGDYGRWRVTSDGYLADDAGVQAIGPWDTSVGDVEHIARWDPKRVLDEVTLERADIDAKRAILDLHAPQPTGYVDGVYYHGEAGQLQCEHCAEQCHSHSGVSCDMPDAPWPCPTVRLLAQPYAGRPGWREEWRDQG